MGAYINHPSVSISLASLLGYTIANVINGCCAWEELILLRVLIIGLSSLMADPLGISVDALLFLCNIWMRKGSVVKNWNLRWLTKWIMLSPWILVAIEERLRSVPWNVYCTARWSTGQFCRLVMTFVLFRTLFALPYIWLMEKLLD